MANSDRKIQIPALFPCVSDRTIVVGTTQLRRSVGCKVQKSVVTSFSPFQEPSILPSRHDDVPPLALFFSSLQTCPFFLRLSHGSPVLSRFLSSIATAFRTLRAHHATPDRV